MEVLNSEIDLENFYKSLKSDRQKVLLLDYDGTLAPFRKERDKAYPHDGIPEILDEMIESGKIRVVIISGRAIKDLEPLLKLKNMPEIWGSHGWEHIDEDGNYTAFKLSKDMMQGLIDAKAWVEKQGYEDRSELKHGCLALHWRGLSNDEISKIKSSAVSELFPIASRSSLELRDFDGGIELRAPGKDKGDAVKKILSDLSGAVISYLGDDLTDEDAFRALGTSGLSVLVNSSKRPTSADLWLESYDELLEYLNTWKASIN
jgi:trehalose-phosphatase